MLVNQIWMRAFISTKKWYRFYRTISKVRLNLEQRKRNLAVKSLYGVGIKLGKSSQIKIDQIVGCRGNTIQKRRKMVELLRSPQAGCSSGGTKQMFCMVKLLKSLTMEPKLKVDTLRVKWQDLGKQQSVMGEWELNNYEFDN
jgi:hypothetical protein